MSARYQILTCLGCSGSGEVRGETCPVCKGAGASAQRTRHVHLIGAQWVEVGQPIPATLRDVAKLLREDAIDANLSGEGAARNAMLFAAAAIEEHAVEHAQVVRARDVLKAELDAVTEKLVAAIHRVFSR